MTEPQKTAEHDQKELETYFALGQEALERLDPTKPGMTIEEYRAKRGL